jgi:hypothetical protein
MSARRPDILAQALERTRQAIERARDGDYGIDGITSHRQHSNPRRHDLG